MDKYPYYKKIQEAFANKVASMNEGSTKKKKLNIYIEIISEIEKPSNIWVNLSILTFRIVPLWFQHRIQVRYIVRDSVTRVEYSYPMDYDIYYSIALAPIALFGSISDRYQNYPASRVADSLDLFLSDFASRENGITSGGEK
ncbi:hypothetical protein EHQ61_18585 [Leptospira wolffii]|uniref:hypothetical protein n=1 Tax=Leptospira wolffii TaxID=409998 RepID=UPI0010832D15|nr:hypothetical protein [Leptospira wolffii]TGL45277.1 hypothetical protein EHQ61_18585 [Leptospira wolffii]